MAPRRKSSDPTPSIEELPETLRKSIVNLMSRENIDKVQAFDRAATLIDANSEVFEKLVQSRSNSIYKARFMTQINKARAEWKNELNQVSNREYLHGFEDGTEWVKVEENAWHVPCSLCGEPMYFHDYDKNFDQSYELLKQAFKNWRHTKCP